MCKRREYKEESSIGPEVIQSFVGAVHGKGATRGVFITTSRFTEGARKFAAGLPQPRIVLVDGAQLADLMLEHQIGVTVENEYKVYKIDENFFETAPSRIPACQVLELVWVLILSDQTRNTGLEVRTDRRSSAHMTE